MQCFVKFMDKTVEDIEISLIVSWRELQSELFSQKKFAFKIFILKFVNTWTLLFTQKIEQNDLWTC